MFVLFCFDISSIISPSGHESGFFTEANKSDVPVLLKVELEKKNDFWHSKFFDKKKNWQKLF